MKNAPVITLSVAALTLFAALFPGTGEMFEWSRQGIAASHAWRMVTGHFVHFGWSHLTWDVAVFVLLGNMAESLLGASETPVLATRTIGPRHAMNGPLESYNGPVSNRLQLVRRAGFAAFIVGVAVCLSTAVLWLQPHLVSYRGLSGIDSALFGFIAQRLICRGRKLRNPRLMGLSSLLLIGFFMKCGYELATRQSAFASVDAALPFEPVPLVHVLGLLLGIGYASVTAPRDQNRPTTVLRPSNNHKFPHVEGHASSCPGPPTAFQRQSIRHDIGFMLQCHNERKRCFRITPVGQSSRFALSLPPPQPQWPILRQCVDPP